MLICDSVLTFTSPNLHFFTTPGYEK